MHAHGFRYGVIGGSDGHKGSVGMSGLPAAFARELTRESIFEAHRNRHTYATTNARIRLLFTGNGLLMGSETANTDRKVFQIRATGEIPLKLVELLRNGAVERRIPCTDISFERDIEVDDDRPGWWQVRVQQRDDQLAISGPVWFD
jgi:hypothetical protein